MLGVVASDALPPVEVWAAPTRLCLCLLVTTCSLPTVEGLLVKALLILGKLHLRLILLLAPEAEDVAVGDVVFDGDDASSSAWTVGDTTLECTGGKVIPSAALEMPSLLLLSSVEYRLPALLDSHALGSGGTGGTKSPLLLVLPLAGIWLPMGTPTFARAPLEELTETRGDRRSASSR